MNKYILVIGFLFCFLSSYGQGTQTNSLTKVCYDIEYTYITTVLGSNLPNPKNVWNINGGTIIRDAETGGLVGYGTTKIVVKWSNGVGSKYLRVHSLHGAPDDGSSYHEEEEWPVTLRVPSSKPTSPSIINNGSQSLCSTAPVGSGNRTTNFSAGNDGLPNTVPGNNDVEYIWNFKTSNGSYTETFVTTESSIDYDAPVFDTGNSLDPVNVIVSLYSRYSSCRNTTSGTPAIYNLPVYPKTGDVNFGLQPRECSGPIKLRILSGSNIVTSTNYRFQFYVKNTKNQVTVLGTKTLSGTGLVGQNISLNNVSNDHNGKILYVDIKSENGNAPSACFLTKNLDTITSVTRTFTIAQLNKTDETCPAADDGRASVRVASGGITGVTYEWNTGATSATVTELNSGTYTVKATDDRACESNELSIPIISNSLFNASARLINKSGSNYPITCNGSDDGEIEVSWQIGNASDYTISWRHDGKLVRPILLNEPNGVIAKNLPPGTYLVSIAKTTQNKCKVETGPFYMEEPDEIDFDLTPQLISGTGIHIACNGENTAEVTLSNVTGGIESAAYSYTTSNVPGIEYISSNQSVSITNVAEGNLSVVVEDANSCSKTKNTTIIESPILTASIAWIKDVSCSGRIDGQVRITAGGGQGGYEYSIDGIDWKSTNIISVYEGRFRGYVRDQYQCSVASTGTTIVSAPSQITVNKSSQNPKCYGGSDGSISLNVIPNGNTIAGYSWKKNGVLLSGMIANSLNDLTIGIYSYTISYGNGCSVSGDVTLNQPIEIELNTQALNDRCYQLGEGQTNVTVSGGTGIYSYSWKNESNVEIGTTQTKSNLLAGTYTVEVKDGNLCVKQNQAIIIEPTELVVEVVPTLYNGATLSCSNSTDGELKTTVSGGTGPFTYQWNKGQQTKDISALVPDVYQLTVTDNKSCQKETKQVSIVPPEPLFIQLLSMDSISCFGTADGKLEIQGLGGTGSYQFSIDGKADQTSSLFENLAAGSHSIRIFDENGCSYNSSFVVEGPDLMIVQLSSKTNSTCQLANGSASVNVQGGTLPYTYSWKNELGESKGNISSISLLSEGKYTVNVSDKFACSASEFQVIIEGSQAPVVQINSVTKPSCVGDTDGSIEMEVISADYPVWVNWKIDSILITELGTKQHQIPNLSEGTLIAQVSDVNGCITPLTSQIDDPEVLSFDFVNSQDPLCFASCDGAIDVVASGGSGGYSYHWTFENSICLPEQDVNGNVAKLSKGIHGLKVVDSKGCEISKNHTLISPDELSFQFSLPAVGNTTVACKGDTLTGVIVTTSGGVEPYTIDWELNGITQPESALIAGNYSINVSDGNGCSTQQNIVISEPEELEISLINKQSSCSILNDGKIEVAAIGGFGTYEFSIDNAPFNVISSWADLSNGSHEVKMKDENSCLSKINVVLDATPFLLVDVINVNKSACSGSTGSAEASVSGGTPNYSYSWLNENKDVLETGSILLNVGVGSYSLKVSDQVGCSVEKIFSISSAEGPIVSNLSTKETNCFGESNGEIQLNVSTLNYPLTITWSDGMSEQLSFETSLSRVNFKEGNYSINVEDNLGCSSVTNFSIKSPNSLSPVLTNIQAPLCFGECNGWMKAEVTGGSGEINFFWTVLNSSCLPVISNDSISEIGAGSFQLKVEDENGCSNQQVFQLTEPNELTATITLPQINGNNVGCSGDVVKQIAVSILGGTAPFVTEWTNELTSDLVSGNWVAGSYSVQTTDVNGCVNQQSIEIVEPDSMKLSLVSTQSPTCFNDSDGEFELQVKNGFGEVTFEWNGLNQLDAVFSQVSAGNYIASAVDENGCSSNLNFTLDEQPELIASLTNKLNQCNGSTGSSKLEITGGDAPYQIVWRDFTNSTIGTLDSIGGLSSGVYDVKVLDASNCESIVPFTITVAQSPTAEIVTTTSAKCWDSSDAQVELKLVENSENAFITWPDQFVGLQRTDLSRGDYLTKVENSQGCFSTLLVQINATDSIGLTVLSAVSPSCQGKCDGEIEVEALGGNGTFNYSWISSGENGNVVRQLCEGIHQLKIEDQEGCSVIKSINLETTVVLEIQLVDQVNPSCYNECEGIVEIAAIGGVGPYSFNWEDGTQDSRKENLCAGNYLIQLSDANNCLAQQTITLINPDSITIEEQAIFPPKCIGDCNGGVEVETSGGTGSFTYLWSNGVTEKDPSNLCSQEYVLEVKDENLCIKTLNVVIASSTQEIADIGDEETFCVGQIETIGIDYLAATYQWMLNDMEVGTSSSYDVSEEGTLVINTIDVDGCVSSDTLLVEYSTDLLSADFLMPSVVTIEDTIVLVEISWPAPEQYSWELPIEATLIEQNDLKTLVRFDDIGNFEVTLHAISGLCVDQLTLPITVEEIGKGREIDANLEEDGILSVQVYPNPTKGEVFTLIKVADKEEIEIRVINLVTGKMFEKKSIHIENEYTLSSDLSFLSSGLYGIEIKSSKQRIVKRIIISK